jgi:myo-inositol 2-dehydrogenase/D-chiro-inositol 1-dehydrogenase
VGRSRQITDGIGIAVIGAGTIGRLRAQNVHRHPSVDYLAVCDIDEAKARAVAEDTEADDWGRDAAALIADDRVDAVIVASTEDAHFDPASAAIEAGKPVLVEKPFTVDLEEGQKLLAAAAEYGVPVYTGFTQRYRRRFMGVMEHILGGYLGPITSATARIYLTRAVGHAVMSRAPSTTPSINTLTYSIDLLLWYLQGARPVTVYAQGSSGEISERYGVPDSEWGVITFDSGTVAQVGVSWELPEIHPAYVASMEVELFGREGALQVKDDHRDVLLVSNQPVPSPYTPHVSMNVAMLGSAMPGDWALGEYFGAMKDETHAFLNTVGTGRPDPLLPSGQDGVDVLEVCLALDRSAATGEVVHLPLDPGR